MGKDGKTSHERLKGRKFTRKIVKFGENVWYLKPKSRGRDKSLSRWGLGIWLGMRDESGEHIIANRLGAFKV